VGRRVPIPEELEAQLLFASDHMCCICREAGKDVQIHHIDSNRTNNNTANLAVVCLDCHSRVTGPRGLGRSYKPREVTLYKQQWEQSVVQRRSLSHGDVPYKSELVSQIDLLFCEYLALPIGDRRGDVLLGQLSHLHDWRGSREVDEKIIEGIEHVALVAGADAQSEKTLVLPDLLLRLCWQYVGPTQAPMDEAGKAHVLHCVGTLATLLATNATLGRQTTVHTMAATGCEGFVRLGILYHDHDIVSAVVDAYESGLESGRKDRLFVTGQNGLLASLGYVRELVGGSAEWAVESQQVSALWHAYGLVFFVVSSKEGTATLSIDHPAANQSLVLPVYPRDGVAEALHLLTPSFAHFAAQWPRVMVPDPAQTDARGFVLEARGLQEQIAADENADALSEVATRNLSDDWRAFFGNKPVPALASRLDSNPYVSNVGDFVQRPEDLGVEWPPQDLLTRPSRN
jgi:hypothetical protein